MAVISQKGLFEPSVDAARPLADRMRPRTLDEFIGQEHILGPGKPLRIAIEAGRAHSMIFWGPPGTGKTTLGRLVATHANACFLSLSAVLSGVKEIREVIAEAKRRRAEHGEDCVLFVDEVHRFNKSQQDAFSAARGERDGRLHRCDHRESVVRAQQRVAVTGANLCPGASGAGGH